MEGMADVSAPSLQDLVMSLEQATLMAKQLPSTNNPTHLMQIYNSLNQAHISLSNFLSKAPFSQCHPFPHPSMNDNSLSSTTSAAFNDDGSEAMQVGDDEDAEAEHNSKGSIEIVEEKMRDCFIKNKRVKRQLSATAAAMMEERRLHDDEFDGTVMDFDHYLTRLRAFEIIYQFHA